MQNTSKTFQMVLVGVFVVLAILGVLGFSGKLPLPQSVSNVDYGTVILWGTLPQSVVQDVLTTATAQKGVVIKYAQKNADTFSRDLVEALATGSGPDLFLLTQDQILSQINKIGLISYDQIPAREFKDVFTEEGELFMRTDGIIAIPILIDPIVMYWNRDLLTSGGVSNPPVAWDQFYGLVSKVAVRDRSGNIQKGLVAFGTYDNISHAKEVLSTLFLQAGVDIVSQSATGQLTAGLNAITEMATAASAALTFFTEFSNPQKDSYSWNRALPTSIDAFASGDLALYFGYASDYDVIRAKNPHLNFDVAAMPEVQNPARKLTFGRMTGVAVVQKSQNPQGALYAALLLGGASTDQTLASALRIPPAQRALLGVRPSDPAAAVFYDAALIAKGWIDPSPAETDRIFREMIGEVTAGSGDVRRAIAFAQNSIAKLLISIPQ